MSSYEFCEVFQNSFLRRFSRLIAFAANWGKIDLSSRSSDQRCSIKRPVLKNFAIFTRKNLRWSFLRPSGMNIYQKEAPTQVLFCEYCEIIKNTYFEKHQRATASSISITLSQLWRSLHLIFLTHFKFNQFDKRKSIWYIGKWCYKVGEMHIISARWYIHLTMAKIKENFLICSSLSHQQVG